VTAEDEPTPAETGLARAALAAFGIPAASRLTLLKRRENVVFRVDRADSGEPAALRIHRPSYQTGGAIRSEFCWMDALRAAGVRTPRALSGRDGMPVQTVAVPGIDGVRHCDVLSWIEGAPLAAGDPLETYRQLGALHARLHAHARAWTPPPWFVRHRWDAPGMLGPDPLWGRYGDLDTLGAAERGLLDRARAAALARLGRYGAGPDRFGLIHADLMPDNVLVHGGEPYIIDFDDSGFGWFMYDLATLLAFDVGGPDFETHRDAWATGYRTVAPLAGAHLAELDTFVMCRLLVGLGWLHTRRETSFARDFAGLVIALACAQAERFLAENAGRPPERAP
jgi:Ser/Thr protein kinase RdoA (MazF antagonist)